MRRLAVLIAVTAVVVLGISSSAWAHVEVSPSSAPKGSDAVLSFVVPNEMDNATTTKVQVQFPIETPIAEALVQPVAGWTAAVAMKHVDPPIKTDSGDVSNAVDTVTWTANSGTKGIAVGDFQAFSVSVGLPDTDSLTFPTIQTYSNGQTVSWIEQTPPGGQPPEHPAPELTLTPGGTTPPIAPTSKPTTAPLTKNLATKSDVDSAKTTAIVGVVVGTIGVLLGAIALIMGARRRRSAT